MLRVAIEELVKEVRITLDENAAQSEYLQANVDNLELDEIIRSKIPDAARDVTETADVELLEPEVMATEVTANDHGGVLTIPEDFLRLVSLKMVGWNRPVTMTAGEGSDIEKMQRNPYTRGNKTKPVCVLSMNAEGKKVLEYFGTSEAVERALYIPIPKEENGTIGISRLLRQAIVKRAAGLTLLSRGETELASVFLG